MAVLPEPFSPNTIDVAAEVGFGLRSDALGALEVLAGQLFVVTEFAVMATSRVDVGWGLAPGWDI